MDLELRSDVRELPVCSRNSDVIHHNKFLDSCKTIILSMLPVTLCGVFVILY